MANLFADFTDGQSHARMRTFAGGTVRVAATAVLAMLSVSLVSGAAAQDRERNRVGDFWTWTPEHHPAPLTPHRHTRGDTGYGDGYWDPDNDIYCSGHGRGRRRVSVVTAQGAENDHGVFGSIQSAVCHTRPGGTVYVEPGVYNESVDIGHPVQIIGAVPVSADVSGEDRAVLYGTDGSCFFIDVPDQERGNRVEISNLWMEGQNASSACITHFQGDLFLHDSAVTTNSRAPGVYLAGGSARIERNVIQGATEGINDQSVGVYVAPAPRSWGSVANASFDILKNEIARHQVGVIVNAPEAYDLGVNVSVKIRMNAITTNRDLGIDVRQGREVLIAANDIFYNGVAGSGRGAGLQILSPGYGGLSVNGNYIGWNEEFGIHAPLTNFENKISNNVIACNGYGGVQPIIFEGDNVIVYNNRYGLIGEEVGYDGQDRQAEEVCYTFDFYGTRSGQIDGLQGIPTAGR